MTASERDELLAKLRPEDRELTAALLADMDRERSEFEAILDSLDLPMSLPGETPYLQKAGDRSMWFDPEGQLINETDLVDRAAIAEVHVLRLGGGWQTLLAVPGYPGDKLMVSTAYIMHSVGPLSIGPYSVVALPARPWECLVQGPGLEHGWGTKYSTSKAAEQGHLRIVEAFVEYGLTIIQATKRIHDA